MQRPGCGGSQELDADLPPGAASASKRCAANSNNLRCCASASILGEECWQPLVSGSATPFLRLLVRILHCLFVDMCALKRFATTA